MKVLILVCLLAMFSLGKVVPPALKQSTYALGQDATYNFTFQA